MKPILLSICLAIVTVIVLNTISFAGDPMPPPPPVNEKFKQLTQLVGDWIGKSANHPEDAVVSYRLTAGGSALVETLFAGTPMEMVSVYTCEGEEVVMTHYCMLGNQPRMATHSGTGTDKMEFVFRDGGNITSPNDQHMHSLILFFKDHDHVDQEWGCHENGKPIAPHLIALTRKE
jgi:hypothetical protein